jgi:chromosome partitioning protein
MVCVGLEQPLELLPIETRAPAVIVAGNIKGGAGKSTVAMHLAIALTRMGKKVGVIDLDVRQRTLSRYLQNRAAWMAQTGRPATMPEQVDVAASAARDLDVAEAEEAANFEAALQALGERCSHIVIDAPGGDTFLSRLAHGAADTLISPLNDSFIDFDLLGDIDQVSFEVLKPSFYAELVWESRKRKAITARRPIDWVVMRNRLSAGRIESKNGQRVAEALKMLSPRIGFRLAPGLTERVIYRELFPKGLTLLDQEAIAGELGMAMSHVAARQELRELMIVLKLPGLEGASLAF